MTCRIRQSSISAEARRKGAPGAKTGAPGAVKATPHLLVDGGLTIGQRHAWDPEAPGMFDALTAMEEAAKAGASA